MNLLIKPTSSLCNIECEYCFYLDECNNRKIKSYGMMTDETLELTVKKALMNADGSAVFAFQGGEPTLIGIDFYKRLLEFEGKYNTNNVKIINTIQTNGVLIDGEWAAFLSDNHFLVGLSLDGTREAHNKYRKDKNGKGTWDKALKAAELLQSAGAEYNVLCVITSANAKNGELVYNTLKKHKYLQFIPCIDGFDNKKRAYSLSKNKYAEFLCAVFPLYYRDLLKGEEISIRLFDNYIDILRGKAPEMCGLSGKCACYGVIEADGSVYPCDFYATDEWRLGNVNEDGFSALFASDTAKRFILSSYEKSDDCKSCQYRALCGGGCRREREEQTQKYRYCESIKAFLDKNYKLLYDLAVKYK